MTAPAHRVHGLKADEVPPDWPPLTSVELAPLFASHPALGTPRNILWHSPRPLSAAALVDTTAGRVFVKRHHVRVRSVATLTEEHRFAAHLRAHGLPIPAVLTPAVALGDWVYEVHALAAGIDRYRDSMSWVPPDAPPHAHAAGAMLARLHTAAAGYTAPQRDTHVLVARSDVLTAVDPLAALAAQLPQRPGLAAFLHRRDWRRELADVFATRDAAIAASLAAQTPLWTHGDWHVSNLCWQDASISSVLDFGLAARNFALFDLATAIERNAIAWLEPGSDLARPAIARALLEGYASVRPLSGADLALIADLLPIVHVDFALSEVEYFSAIVGAPDSAEVAWHTFLRGHADWFRGAVGRDLLEVIRATATAPAAA